MRLNRFHTAGQGQITLTLLPDGGGSSLEIKVVCGTDASRTVTGPSGIDVEFIVTHAERNARYEKR